MNLNELMVKLLDYSSNDYSVFLEDYEDEIDDLSIEGRFILLKDLYITAKNGDKDVAELLQYEVGISGVPECETKNIKDNIKFNVDGFITVYRGINTLNDTDGGSYTLNKNVAEKFAKRFGENGKVIQKNITINDVIFYSNSRNEQEIFLKNNVN